MAHREQLSLQVFLSTPEYFVGWGQPFRAQLFSSDRAALSGLQCIGRAGASCATGAELSGPVSYCLHLLEVSSCKRQALLWQTHWDPSCQSKWSCLIRLKTVFTWDPCSTKASDSNPKMCSCAQSLRSMELIKEVHWSAGICTMIHWMLQCNAQAASCWRILWRSSSRIVLTSALWNSDEACWPRSWALQSPSCQTWESLCQASWCQVSSAMQAQYQLSFWLGQGHRIKVWWSEMNLALILTGYSLCCILNVTVIADVRSLDIFCVTQMCDSATWIWVDKSSDNKSLPQSRRRL